VQELQALLSQGEEETSSLDSKVGNLSPSSLFPWH
jgi:hypothetical protein